MKRHLILLALVPILVLLNYAVYERENLRQGGELVLLELAPVDPRSLMQGDYMRLRYSVSQDANAAWQQRLKQQPDLDEKSGPKARQMVIRLDAEKKASFVRFYDKVQSLAENERLITFQFDADGGTRAIQLAPQSFFFQEGHGDFYNAARFGMMHLRADGEHILVGLADKAGVEIKP
nr:GDYXXLXY domain-containing protein [uncultured Cohaesibacter sp.]